LRAIGVEFRESGFAEGLGLQAMPPPSLRATSPRSGEEI
jgi:hypothetical protein